MELAKTSKIISLVQFRSRYIPSRLPGNPLNVAPVGFVVKGNRQVAVVTNCGQVWQVSTMASIFKGHLNEQPAVIKHLENYSLTTATLAYPVGKSHNLYIHVIT